MYITRYIASLNKLYYYLIYWKKLVQKGKLSISKCNIILNTT